MIKKVIIKNKWKETFHSKGLESFNSFMSEKEFYKLITKEKNGAVYKLNFEDESNFYLKLKYKEQKRKIVRAILRKGKYIHPIVNEVQNTQFLQSLNFETAKIAAWGYSKKFGITQASFIITEEVKGEEFIDLYEKSDFTFRQQMYTEYGKLLGIIHYNRIDSYIRIQDLLCNISSNGSPKFTIIDREVGSLNKRRISVTRLKDILARIFYEVLKRYKRIPISSKEGLSFCKAYLEINKQIQLSPHELFQQILDKIRDFISKRKSFYKLKHYLPRELFSGMAPSVTIK